MEITAKKAFTNYTEYKLDTSTDLKHHLTIEFYIHVIPNTKV